MARKKFPKVALIVLGVLVALLLVSNQSGLFAADQPSFFVLSLDKLDYVNAAGAISDKYVANIVLGLTGEALVGKTNSKHFSASELQASEPAVKNGFSVSANITKSACSSEFTMNPNNRVYEYRIRYMGSVWYMLDDSLEEKCVSDGAALGSKSTPQVIVGGLTGKKVFCWDAIPTKILGDISSNRYDFEAEFKFTSDKVGTQPIVATLNNGDKQTATAGSLAVLNWVATLPGTESCDLNYMVVQTIPGSDFYVSSYTSFAGLQGLGVIGDRVEACVADCVQKRTCTWDNVQSVLPNCVNEYNTAAGRVGTRVISSDAKVVGGRVIEPKQPGTHRPMVQLKVDAEWMGVREFKGKPELQTVSGSTINSGMTGGKITGTVKNIGDDTGVFNIGASCSSGFDPKSISITVAPGDVEPFEFTVNGQCTSVLKGSCAVTATDSQGGGVSQKDVSMGCTPLKECSLVGEERCVGKEIWTCAADMTYKYRESCAGTCTITDTKAVCSGGDEPRKTGVCLPYVQDLGNDGKCVFNTSIYYLIVGILAVVAVYWFSSGGKPSGGNLMSEMGLGGL